MPNSKVYDLAYYRDRKQEPIAYQIYLEQSASRKRARTRRRQDERIRDAANRIYITCHGTLATPFWELNKERQDYHIKIAMAALYPERVKELVG